MISDFILDAAGALLEFVINGWRPTPRQRVKRALRMSHKTDLTAKRRDYAIGWLRFGLDNLTDLRFESRKQEIRNALETLIR